MHTLHSTTAMSTRSNRLAVGNQNTRSPALRLRFDPAHAEPSTGYEITPAILGNHLAIQGFMHRTLHRPSPAEFASSTIRPDYVPSERLLIRRPTDRSLVGHVQVESQLMQFGNVRLPISRLRDLAMLPEYSHLGFDDRIVVHAERVAKDDGAMLIVSRGEDRQLLGKHGWSSLGNDPVSMVSPQRLLGQLPQPREPESPFYGNQLPTPEVRIARFTDVAILRGLYNKHLECSLGTIVRSEDHWSWLLTKGTHDRIYVCFEDGQPLTYVVVRGGSVLELIDLTPDSRGAARLMKHVGADAIEQGRYSLRIYAPLTDQVHQWANLAGGQIVAAVPEDSWMVKILSMRKVMRRLATELHRRARPAGPLSELSVRVGEEEFLIKSGVRSMRVTRGTSNHQIGLTCRAATQLVLGYRSVDELGEDRQLVASSAEALATARTLFPTLNLWRTRWDDVPILNS